MRYVSIILLISAIVLACQKDKSIYLNSSFVEQFKLPAIEHPADNKPSSERIALGKYLFYNPVLSLDSSVSCASCHLPKYAFSGQLALGIGSNKQQGSTNSPSLSNIALHPYLTRAGGVPSLEIQVLVPIQEHSEFNNNILDIAKRLEKDTYFTHLSNSSYPNKPDYFAITASLAAFERTFISDNSKFDKYLKGRQNLSPNEIAGLELFFSNRTNCSKCHSGFNFTNYSFENNAAARVDKDSGRYRLTRNSSEIGLFKVPSLRNIEFTAPYMHDGSLQTIKDVLKSYNTGGKHPTYKNKLFIKPLGLNKTELKQLEAFLNTLSDFQFINNPKFKKP